MNLHKITICGGGNGAQTLAAIATHNLGCQIDIYAPLADEAERLRTGIEAHDGLETVGAVRVKAAPRRVSADPAEVIPGSQMVVMVLPAFAHELMLEQIAPFLEPGGWVGAMPARGGFDYAAVRALNVHGRDDVRLFGLQTLPWACRIREYGRTVEVLGVKNTVDAACRPAAQIEMLSPLLARMLGLTVGSADNMLALTLANTGQIIHPGIMYGLFADWDGASFGVDEIPLFYQGLSEAGARVLAGLSADVQAIRARLSPALDLAAVHPLKDWLLHSYGALVADPSSLHSAFVSNRAYAGLRAPVREIAPGRFVPDFQARYLAEDVPFGLTVTRAIAGLAGVETPTVDRVMAWAGEKLGQDLLDHDARRARIPQKYGLQNLEQLIAFSVKG